MVRDLWLFLSITKAAAAEIGHWIVFFPFRTCENSSRAFSFFRGCIQFFPSSYKLQLSFFQPSLNLFFYITWILLDSIRFHFEDPVCCSASVCLHRCDFRPGLRAFHFARHKFYEILERWKCCSFKISICYTHTDNGDTNLFCTCLSFLVVSMYIFCIIKIPFLSKRRLQRRRRCFFIIGIFSN